MRPVELDDMTGCREG